MWTSGSESSSTMLRSSSVSSPLRTSCTCLFCLAARSRTRRFIFWNVALIGTMRSDMVVRWSSLVMRRSWARLRARCRLGSFNNSGSWTTMDSEMTSSPTRSMRLSSFCVSTFTKPAALWPGTVAAGVPPAVEGGILPPGPGGVICNAFELVTSVPPGETPGSTAGGPPAATVFGAAATGASGLARMALTRAINAPVGTRIGCPALWPFNCARICVTNFLSASPPSRITSMIGELSASLCWRVASRSDSSSCASAWIGSRLRNPEPPLNVWNARKIVLSVSALVGSSSSTSTPFSMFARCSWDSLINSERSSWSAPRFRTSGVTVSSAMTGVGAADGALAAAGGVAAGAAFQAAGNSGSGCSFWLRSSATFIHECHCASHSMDAASNLAEVSKILSTQARASFTALTISGAGGFFRQCSSICRRKLLMGSSPVSLSGSTKANSNASELTISTMPDSAVPFVFAIKK